MRLLLLASLLAVVVATAEGSPLEHKIKSLSPILVNSQTNEVLQLQG